MPFRFDSYEPAGGSIADLIMAGPRARANAARVAGDAQARAAEVRGQNSGQMWGTLGALAQGITGQIAQHYQDAPKREMEGLRLESAKREMAATDRGARDTATAKAIMPFALVENEDGVSTFDRNILTREFTAAGLGDRLPDLMKGLDDADAASLGLRKARQDFAQKGLDGLLRSVDAAGATPAGLKLAADYAVKNGLYSQEQADSVLKFVGDDPARAKAAIQRLRGEKPELHNAPAGTAVFDANDPQSGPIATVPSRPEASAFQAKEVLVNGKTLMATFDTNTGKYYDPATMQELAGAQPVPPRDPASQGGGTPYFTYQTVFDHQGRPTGALRFDARGGPPQFVDVSAMTGGGQLKGPPGTTGQDSIRNDAALDQLDRLIAMFNGGAKDLVGPLEGRARAIGQNVPGVPVNEAFADFKAATDAFKNGVIKAITGAQMSEPEAKRIVGQIPLETDKPMVWMAKALQSQKNLQDLEKRIKAARPDRSTSGAFTVSTPDGQTFTFPDRASADAFKLRAGIK